MMNLLQAKLKLLSLQSTVGAGANKTYDLQPGQGIDWYPIWLVMYHDDGGGARNSKWSWTDGTNTINYETISLTQYQRINLITIGSDVRTGRGLNGWPPKINNDIYPIANVDSLGAGKYIFVQGLVYEVAGVY